MTQSKTSLISKFLKLESAGGLLLILTALLAVIIANSPLADIYQSLLNIPVKFQFSQLEISKPLLLWVNDGLMAIFFFLVGLELKRELKEGELSKKGNVILPGIGALGGMVVPALIYTLFNYQDPIGRTGWAIPAATDIAFALGILFLLGSRVPLSLKIFLTSLAIFDDIGAILIIGIFYTPTLHFDALAVVVVSILLLALLNKKKVVKLGPYMILGLVLWVATLKSGIHATLAGVVLAMFIPLKSEGSSKVSPLKYLEHKLHGFVSFMVLPVFAFMNTGINFSGMNLSHLIHNVPLGISVGLFAGKIVGVFGFCFVLLKLKLVKFPDTMNYGTLFGISALCGIGFTMSMFIGGLAFDKTQSAHLFDERVGIILGSLVSGAVGYFILLSKLPKKPLPE